MLDAEVCLSGSAVPSYVYHPMPSLRCGQAVGCNQVEVGMQRLARAKLQLCGSSQNRATWMGTS